MIDHEQICLTSSLITTQTLVVVSHTACAHVGGPKVRGTLGPTSWDGMWLTHRNTLLPMLRQNFVAVGQTVWAHVNGPKNWGRWAWDGGYG